MTNRTHLTAADVDAVGFYGSPRVSLNKDGGSVTRFGGSHDGAVDIHTTLLDEGHRVRNSVSVWMTLGRQDARIRAEHLGDKVNVTTHITREGSEDRTIVNQYLTREQARALRDDLNDLDLDA